MKLDDADLQTPEQRENALIELAENVFFEFSKSALNKPSKTYKGHSPIEYVRKGIEEFREIEKTWLLYEREC
ncbi:MAG: hypothetical protein ACLFR0_04175 [Alphaproteobacteria bacterium]